MSHTCHPAEAWRSDILDRMQLMPYRCANSCFVPGCSNQATHEIFAAANGMRDHWNLVCPAHANRYGFALLLSENEHTKEQEWHRRDQILGDITGRIKVCLARRGFLCDREQGHRFLALRSRERHAVAVEWGDDNPRVKIRLLEDPTAAHAWLCFVLDLLLHRGKVEDWQYADRIGENLPVRYRYSHLEDVVIEIISDTSNHSNVVLNAVASIECIERFRHLFDPTRKRIWFWQSLRKERPKLGHIAKL